MQVLGKNFKTESLSTLYDSSASTPKSTQTQTQTQTNPNDGEQVNLAQMAGGKNGSLEIQKYLYETGLQNIFNDYNKQIASLDASKQKEIEDAYYVRELSKKYLGGYASNTGIGDVSGQLLDIYGNYQSNMNEINANFTELQTGLESSYSDKKNEYELGLLQTQMDIETVEQQERLDEMSDTVSGALKNTNDYENQGEWDTYVDSLLSNESINKQKADYLKGMYEFEQNTNFTKNNNININSDIAYYNPDNLNIVSKGNVYESRNRDYILAETNNVVDSYSSLYEKLDEVGVDMAFDTPFAYNGKWFIKETKGGKQVYTEYVKSNNYNKLTGTRTISSSNESQKEMYDTIHKTLNGKDGYVKTTSGMLAYKYNSETREYTPYLDFQAGGVGGEKGNFNIGGVMYKIKKKYKNNGSSGIIDVKDDWKKGNWKKDYVDKHNAKAIVQTMIDNYFGGDNSKFSDYIEGSRSGGKNKINNRNSIVVEYDGAYYTINDGELWELSKK